jgi:hypothetical protein
MEIINERSEIIDKSVENFDSMTEKFTLTYYYISPQDSERIEQFKSCSGDSEKILVTQYVRGWLGRNRDYYLDLARMDAEARGIPFREWGETVVNKGVEALPGYKKEIGDIPPNPLRDIALSPDVIRKGINYIALGKQNLALLKVGVLYDRDNAIGFISRIIKEHLTRNWEKLYLPQVEAENFENWK